MSREDDYNTDDIDDETYDSDEEYQGGMLRWLSIMFVIAALGGFIALAWYAYQSSMEPISEEEIPLVAANTEPYKEKPEDPGGLQFEHQDKSVYNQLAAGKGEGRPMAERLMPPPEEPVERAQPEPVNPDDFQREPVETISGATAVATPIPEIKEGEAVKEEAQPANAEVAPATAAEKATVVASEKSNEDTIKVIEPEAPVAPAKPAEPPAPSSGKSASSGQFMAQLGAFSSHDDAKAAWTKIKAAHGSMFPTKEHQLQSADVNGKTYHRLQIGPFDSETSARKVCEYLQKNKQACFVVSVK
ncbi:MAG: SPOR domain-containing protein [Alphaproteobacteria bacterium]|nr:SPOR domain-containing protein [Alphaproteobacteria bacterium]